MYRFINAFKEHYRPLQNAEEFNELKLCSGKERRHTSQRLGYRNAFFTLLMVNVVVVVLWLSIIIDKRKGYTSNSRPLSILEDRKPRYRFFLTGRFAHS